MSAAPQRDASVRMLEGCRSFGWVSDPQSRQCIDFTASLSARGVVSNMRIDGCARHDYPAFRAMAGRALTVRGFDAEKGRRTLPPAFRSSLGIGAPIYWGAFLAVSSVLISSGSANTAGSTASYTTLSVVMTCSIPITRWTTLVGIMMPPKSL